MLWSSYRLGYAHGRNNARHTASATPSINGNLQILQPLLSLCTFAASPPRAPLEPPPTFAGERRSPR
jgi:hypothetical protein